MEITTALSGIKGTIDLLKMALAARDDAKIQSAIQDLSSRLSDALMSALTTAEKAHALETALRKAEREKSQLEEKLADRAVYRLEETAYGSFAYAFQPLAEGADIPKHYLCQPCYDKGVKAILRAGTNAVSSIWMCPEERGHTIARRS